METPEKAK